MSSHFSYSAKTLALGGRKEADSSDARLAWPTFLRVAVSYNTNYMSERETINATPVTEEQIVAWAAEERDRAATLARRAQAYKRWLDTREILRDDFVRHCGMAEVMAGLGEATAHRSESEHYELLLEYVGWAEEHLHDADPF